MKGNTLIPLARHLQRGKDAETLAIRYLAGHGLEYVSRNFRSRHGEIDLVMQDTDSLVFVEVRYRSSNKYGNAMETILHDKISRLKCTAELFLQQHREYRNLYCRFDVIGINGPLHKPEIHWIKDAF